MLQINYIRISCHTHFLQSVLSNGKGICYTPNIFKQLENDGRRVKPSRWLSGLLCQWSISTEQGQETSECRRVWWRKLWNWLKKDVNSKIPRYFEGSLEAQHSKPRANSLPFLLKTPSCWRIPRMAPIERSCLSQRTETFAHQSTRRKVTETSQLMSTLAKLSVPSKCFYFINRHLNLQAPASLCLSSLSTLPMSLSHHFFIDSAGHGPHHGLALVWNSGPWSPRN